MEHSQNTHGTRTGHSSDTHRTLIEHAPDTHGTLTEHLWNKHGTLTGHSSDTHGTLTEHALDILADNAKKKKRLLANKQSSDTKIANSNKRSFIRNCAAKIRYLFHSAKQYVIFWNFLHSLLTFCDFLCTKNVHYSSGNRFGVNGFLNKRPFIWKYPIVWFFPTIRICKQHIINHIRKPTRSAARQHLPPYSYAHPQHAVTNPRKNSQSDLWKIELITDDYLMG